MKTRAPAEQGQPETAPAGLSSGAGSRRRRMTSPSVSRRRPPKTTFSPPPPISGPLAVADPGTMVGRPNELNRLRALWDEAASGKTRVALVGGEPGVGKTRLAAELAGIVEASGGRVLVGRCRPDGGIPFQPFVDALGPALRGCSEAWLDRHVEQHGQGLARLFPELAARMGNPVVDSQVRPRARLLGAIAAAVRELDPMSSASGSGAGPCLLVVEDLQWATRSTVLVLDHLVHHDTSRPLLIVGTYRDAAIHPSHPLSDFLHRPTAAGHERIVLGALPPQAVTALLVDRAAVAGRAAGNLAKNLWRITEGDPLVLTELVRELVGSGALTGGAVRPDSVDLVGGAHDIAEVVGRRLGRPASPVRAVVEAASVVDGPFSADVLASLGELKEDEIRACLAEAASAAVIVPVAGRAGYYDFIHDAVRQHAYEMLTANRRVRLHRAFAEHLERPEVTPPAQPAEILHHVAAGTPVGRSPDAVHLAERAGEAAMEMLAYEEAADFFGRALAFLGTRDRPSLRVDLLVRLAAANQCAGESARARQSYLQAAAIARGRKDGPRLGRAVLGLGEVLDVWGADGILIGLLEEAAEANPDDPSLRAKLLARLAQARASFDTPDERKAQSDRAWELAWDSRDPETMGTVLRARHEALSAPDDLEDRVEIDGELFAMASSSKDPELALLTYRWRLVDLIEQGYIVDADRDRKAHAQLARKSGDTVHRRDAEVWAATWALLEGRSERASSHIDRALSLSHRARDPQAASIYWRQQQALMLDWGTPAEIDGLVDVWRDLVRSHDRDPAWRSSLALLLVRSGRLDEAALELDDLLTNDCGDLPEDRAWIETVAAIGEVAATLGDGRSSYLAKLLAPYHRRMIVVGPGLVCRGSVSRVLGLLHAVTKNWEAVERHFQAALSAHERVGSGPLLARSRSDFGRTMARMPGGPLHTGRVKQILGQAIEEATRYGMATLEAETRAALDRVR